jgi:hypothetical protein
MPIKSVNRTEMIISDSEYLMKYRQNKNHVIVVNYKKLNDIGKNSHYSIALLWSTIEKECWSIRVEICTPPPSPQTMTDTDTLAMEKPKHMLVNSLIHNVSSSTVFHILIPHGLCSQSFMFSIVNSINKHLFNELNICSHHCLAHVDISGLFIQSNFRKKNDSI